MQSICADTSSPSIKLQISEFGKDIKEPCMSFVLPESPKRNLQMVNNMTSINKLNSTSVDEKIDDVCKA
jgi:hypothetical protein